MRGNFRKNIRIRKLQTKHKMIGQTFNVLGPNERRDEPWLGGTWYEPGNEEKRAEYIREYQEETARMLIENPNLKIVR